MFAFMYQLDWAEWVQIANKPLVLGMSSKVFLQGISTLIVDKVKTITHPQSEWASSNPLRINLLNRIKMQRKGSKLFEVGHLSLFLTSE
jgi:hypothetical protein